MIQRKQFPVLAALLVAAAALVGCGKPSHTPRPIDAERVALIRDEISTGAGGGGATESRPDPTGFATLTGSFKFAAADAGQFASRPALPLSGGDAAFCSQGEAPKSSAILVNQDGALENVVVYLGDDLSKMENQDLWVHPSAAPGKTDPVVFDQDKCVFLSPVTLLQVSQPMDIRNSDGVAHNTKPIAGVIPPGGSASFVHKKEERQPYAVTCNIHPWMAAYVLPRTNGYFAKTDDDGNFTIENLPAGVELNIKVWHEKVGFVQEVTVNGEKLTWSKKGFTITLTPDQETNLEVVLGAAPFAG